MIEDLFQIEIKDDTMKKMKEDLTIVLQNKFNRDTEAELIRLREVLEDEKTRSKEDLEAKYCQTIQDLKAKADEFEAKNNELGVLLDEMKAENNNLKEQIDEHKLENEGLI